MASPSKNIAAMTQDEDDKFKLLGTRVAQWRKASHDVSRRRIRASPASVLVRHMERISALPKTQQKFVIQALASVLAQASTEAAAR